MSQVKSENGAKLTELIKRRKEHAAAIAEIDVALQRIGEHLGSKNGVRSGPHSKMVAALRRNLNISQAEFARITGYSVRAIAGLEAGKVPSASAGRKIKEVTRLLTALSELMPPGQVGEWLRQPNEAFQGQAPMHVMELGKIDQIWEMVHQIDANVAN